VVGNARLYHLDPALVAAVIYQGVRGFDATARSDAGAVGLMQLLPTPPAASPCTPAAATSIPPPTCSTPT
jgi:hypothetical protein